MITFDVNNCGKVTLEQKTHDKSVTVTHGNGNITTIRYDSMNVIKRLIING